MIVFEFVENGEFKDNRGLRVLVIGETYRAYETHDGNVLLNDEVSGYTFQPAETYEDFRTKFNLYDTISK